MAEAVFASRASRKPHLARRIKVDSCGTAAYHVGEAPDERTVATCEKVCRSFSSLPRVPLSCLLLELIWAVWVARRTDRFPCAGPQSGGFLEFLPYYSYGYQQVSLPRAFVALAREEPNS